MMTAEPQAYSEPAQVVSKMMHGDADREEGGAGPVDLVRYPLDREVEHGGHDEQGDDADRHVDVEDPAPRQVLGEEAAEQRARHVGDAEDDAEVAHVLAPLPGRDDVAHDGLGPDHQPAGADALHRPEGDELDHGLGQARQHRADQEDHDGQLEERSCGRRGRRAFPTAAWRCRWSAGRPSPPTTGG